jgi:hypothetical protein
MTLSREILTALLGASLIVVGCAHGSPRQAAAPIVVVSPGLRERLAWMDRVRHSEGAVRTPTRSETPSDEPVEQEEADTESEDAPTF